jgi:alpha-L-fucosidase
MQKQLLTLSFYALTTIFAVAQTAPKPYGATPSKAQLNWHEMEMYCIIHFGVDTYTDKEWGYGDEDPKLINPVKFNAKQIVGAAKAGGFKGVIIVAKHHDGLCLWPTQTTEHNISKSTWKNGHGDMVREYQIACKKLGMQMGIYCSPWDRNSAYYGQSDYIKIYRNQLKELYSRYGKLFISWHDGANGGDGYYGGTREIRKIDRTNYYGWDSTWAITLKMQPSANIFGDVGPDVRWVGNEEGVAGETSWATYDPQAPDVGKQPANGYSKYEMATEGTLNGKHWMPAECDVSLRPGWFYHASQNSRVKTPYELLDLYYKSVGRGANLDLGLSPNPQGLLDPEDVASLKEFGRIIKQTFAKNLALGATLIATNIRANNTKRWRPEQLLDNNRYTYWATDDQINKPQLTLNLVGQKTFNVIRLRENIKLGQRIRAFTVEAYMNGNWKELVSATSIGANRLIRLPQNVTTNKVRLSITQSPVCIALSDFGLYKEPSHLTAPIIKRDLAGNVSITTSSPVSSIRYTIGGGMPNVKSPIYKGNISMPLGGIIKAIALDGDQQSEIVSRHFFLSKAEWRVTAAHKSTSQGKPDYAIDDDPNTTWSSITNDTTNQFIPVELVIDMNKPQDLKGFTYLPRQDKKLEGLIDQFAIFTSNDRENWQPIAQGEFSNIKSNPVEQLIDFKQAVNARYIKFKALHVISGNGATVAELGIMVQ